MILRMTIEVELDDAWIPTDYESQRWLEDTILVGDKSLTIDSTKMELGDIVGVVTKVENIDYIMHEVKSKDYE